jgi:RHS repeat-associated protein
LRHTFTCDNQNQLTSITRSGTYTVSGTTWGPATNVTVNTLTAIGYADATFARTNVTLINGTNTFTAVAADGLGRWDTNTIKAYLPSTVSFKYDGNGNLRTNGTRIFDYDDENQLITITEPNAWRSHFAYDGKMRRRTRTECTWNGSVWVTNLIVRYVYDGKLVVQERHFNPQLSTQTPFNSITYTRGRDLSGSLQGAGGIGGLLARTDNGQLTTGDPQAHACYHSDANGNVTALINDKQIVVARYLYDPCGNLLSSVGPLAEVNLYRFSSKEAHAYSGLVYYGYRFLDPNLQRWLNRDPLGEKGGINLYTFTSNGHTYRVDPFGLDALGDARANLAAAEAAFNAAQQAVLTAAEDLQTAENSIQTVTARLQAAVQAGNRAAAEGFRAQLNDLVCNRDLLQKAWEVMRERMAQAAAALAAAEQALQNILRNPPVFPGVWTRVISVLRVIGNGALRIIDRMGPVMLIPDPELLGVPGFDDDYSPPFA